MRISSLYIVQRIAANVCIVFHETLY